MHQLTNSVTIVPELQGTTADIAKQKCKMAAEMVRQLQVHKCQSELTLSRSMDPVLPRIHACVSMP